MIGFKFEKAIQLLNLFAKKNGGSLNKFKALQLMWLTDRHHLQKYASTIANETYYASKSGIIPSFTKDLLSDFSIIDEERIYRDKFLSISGNLYNSICGVEGGWLEQTEVIIAETIYNLYFNSAIDHTTFPEWKKYEPGLVSGGASRLKMNYYDFFFDEEKTIDL